MSKGLFLHYGPGGNAAVERAYFESEQNYIDLCDQPLDKSNEKYLDLLLSWLEKNIQQHKPSFLIGHSFGCDLISQLSKDFDIKNLPVIFVSPLGSINQSMLKLAQNLNKFSIQPDLDLFIRSLQQEKSNASEPEKFWTLCYLVSQHPFYQSIFWRSQNHLKKVAEISNQSRAFDAEYWQNSMSDYLFTRKQSLSVKNLNNVVVVLGKNDPYIDKNDIDFWVESLGVDRVHLLDEAGHFPHIEQKSEFLKVMNKILEKNLIKVTLG